MTSVNWSPASALEGKWSSPSAVAHWPSTKLSVMALAPAAMRASRRAVRAILVHDCALLLQVFCGCC